MGGSFLFDHGAEDVGDEAGEDAAPEGEGDEVKGAVIVEEEEGKGGDASGGEGEGVDGHKEEAAGLTVAEGGGGGEGEEEQKEANAGERPEGEEKAERSEDQSTEQERADDEGTNSGGKGEEVAAISAKEEGKVEDGVGEPTGEDEKEVGGEERIDDRGECGVDRP